MAEVIVFPDVEALVAAYLQAELRSRPAYADIKVTTKVPKPRPEMFVRVIRTGGVTANLVTDEAVLAVEAWASGTTAEADAVALAQLCRGLLHAIDMVDEVQFYRPRTASAPANLPDPSSGQVRYTATYAVRARGAAE